MRDNLQGWPLSSSCFLSCFVHTTMSKCPSVCFALLCSASRIYFGHILTRSKASSSKRRFKREKEEVASNGAFNERKMRFQLLVRLTFKMELSLALVWPPPPLSSGRIVAGTTFQHLQVNHKIARAPSSRCSTCDLRLSSSNHWPLSSFHLVDNDDDAQVRRVEHYANLRDA